MRKLKLRRGWYRAIMNLTGSEVFAGSPGDPPQARTLYYADGVEVGRDNPGAYVIASNNDGFELWIGTRHMWYTHLRSDEVWLLTKWLMWDWYVKARWLGLRRPIYYWALRCYLRQIMSRPTHGLTVDEEPDPEGDSDE